MLKRLSNGPFSALFLNMNKVIRHLRHIIQHKDRDQNKQNKEIQRIYK